MRAVMQAEMRVQRWPPQCVRESVLPSCLLVVRTARGDRGSVRQCIKRVCGQGYCGIAPVEERTGDGAAVEAPVALDRVGHAVSWGIVGQKSPEYPLTFFGHSCVSALSTHA